MVFLWRWTVKLPCDKKKEFKCRDSGACIPAIATCDDHENCKDGSDELHCGALSCPVSLCCQFKRTTA